MRNFYDLFISELKDIYAAEILIVDALPAMIKSAHSHVLKEGLRHHHKETEHQIARLELIATLLNVDLGGARCEAVEGLIKEGTRAMNVKYDNEAHDAAIINAAQRIEHYEIAVYGILKSFAKHLDQKNILKLLEESSKEEGGANKKLNEIAEGSIFVSGINKKAMKHAA